jgi:hypothetical protein
VVPKPQQQHDGNYTNTLVQPVHPAKSNILNAYKITGYMQIFFLPPTKNSQGLFRFVGEMYCLCVQGDRKGVQVSAFVIGRNECVS